MGNFDNKENNNGQGNSSRAKVVGLTKAYANQLATRSRIYDPTIIDRLNRYLIENKDQTYVNLEGITEALRSRYHEYRRRNWNDFKKLVERAFAELSKSAGIDAMDSSGSSGVEECDSNDATINSSNSQVTGLYQRNRKSNDSGRSNDLELINLSSDDEPDPRGARESENESQIPNSLLRIPEISVSRRRRVISKGKESSKIPAKLSTSVTFADFAGCPTILQEVCQLMVHVKHPELFQAFGMSAPRGFLLHGPPGCGKTLLATAIAGELKIPFIKVSGPELVGGVSGESEERVREMFSTALSHAPCVLFIDEVDVITPNRQTAQREMERRIVAQLISSLDDLSDKDKDGQVLVIGATKRPDALDPALRRAGRFDREVCLGIPNEKAREDILRVLCAKVPLSQDLQLSAIARMTPGFVGSDLLSLVRESAMVAITRVLEETKLEPEQVARNGTSSRKRKLSLEIEGPQDVPVKKANTQETPGPKTTEEKKEEKTKVDDVEVEAVSSSVSDAPEKANEADATVANGDGVLDVSMEDTAKESKGDAAEVAIDVENADEKYDPAADVIDVLEPIDEAKPSTVEKTEPIVSLLKLIRSASKLKSEQLSKLQLQQADVMEALKTVQPSAKREGFATVPGVTWDDVGSLVAIRKHLKMAILGPVKYAAQFERLGLVTPAGVLLCGPPGCGKTLLAKAVANEAGINFISVKGPELLNMYVGESERAVRTVFQRARNSTPCVIFFDELDALCPRRIEGDAGAGMRVVNQMLTEMDGVGERRGVFLMAATNRPDIVDPAVLRPGRLDKTIYIGLPSPEDRKDILRAITKNGTKPPLAADVFLDEVAMRGELDNWTGADLAALMREAAMHAMRDALTDVDISAGASNGELELPTDVAVTSQHIQRAIASIRPSVSPKDLKRYEEMRLQFEVNKGGT